MFILQAILLLGTVITGLAYIVRPSAGRDVAKATAKTVVLLFVAFEILAYLWSHWAGRFLLVLTLAVIVMAKRK